MQSGLGAMGANERFRSVFFFSFLCSFSLIGTPATSEKTNALGTYSRGTRTHPLLRVCLGSARLQILDFVGEQVTSSCVIIWLMGVFSIAALEMRCAPRRRSAQQRAPSSVNSHRNPDASQFFVSFIFSFLFSAFSPSRSARSRGQCWQEPDVVVTRLGDTEPNGPPVLLPAASHFSHLSNFFFFFSPGLGFCFGNLQIVDLKKKLNKNKKT